MKFREYLEYGRLDEKVEKLPYESKMYIQKENEKFMVYASTGGSKLPEFVKEFNDQKSALKEFSDAFSRAVKGFKKV
jgi:hypothetical protein